MPMGTIPILSMITKVLGMVAEFPFPNKPLLQVAPDLLSSTIASAVVAPRTSCPGPLRAYLPLHLKCSFPLAQYQCRVIFLYGHRMADHFIELTQISWGQMRALLGSQSDPKLLSFQSLSRRPMLDRSDSDVLLWLQSFNHSQSFLSAELQRTQDVALATPANSLQAYVFLSMAIYLFSNNLVSDWNIGRYRDSFFSKLDVVFRCIPRENLQALLLSRLSSIRAAWEKLLLVAGVCKQAEFFRVMIEVGFTNCWLTVQKMGHTYLSLAASMGLTDVIQRLLSEGCRPDEWSIQHITRWAELEYAIVEALKNHQSECARLLLEACDVNRPLNDTQRSNFKEFSEWYSLSVGNRSQNPCLFRGLQMFVEAGADLDAVFSFPLYFSHPSVDIDWRDLMPRTEWGTSSYYTCPADGWTPSILDYLFYFERPAFDKLAHYSHAFVSNVTRAGVLLALEEDSLESYLSKAQVSRQMPTNKISDLLQVILLEQFVITDARGTPRQTDLKVVHALLKFGIKLGRTAVCYGECSQVSYVLDRLVLQVQRQPQNWLGHEIQALKLLIDHGAVVDSCTLGNAVHSQGTVLLEFLIPHNIDKLSIHGRFALAKAVSLNNIEAVQIFLDAGVDINAEVGDGSESMSILAYALYRRELTETASETIRFLVRRGAILRFSKKMPGPSLLLHHLLISHAPSRSAFRMVRYLVKQKVEYQAPSILSATMLERCKRRWKEKELPSRRAMFRYLFRKGAPVRPGSPLAVWILLGGDTKLLRELLDAGANINCHTSRAVDPSERRTPLQAAASICNEEVVLLLLREGADVNAPAKGEFGFTALQAICYFVPKTQEEQARKIRIIQSLIDHGANVNAAPARDDGVTALQGAARTGQLETAILLLRYGADVNAPPCRTSTFNHRHNNALDVAAQYGRLDMVKLLLSADAHSCTRGSTGYDGAIGAAEDNSHFAVADLIRQHAADAESNGGPTNPYISQLPRDWHAYEHEWASTDDLEDSSEGGLPFNYIRWDMYCGEDNDEEDNEDEEDGEDGDDDDYEEDEEKSNAPDWCRTMYSVKHAAGQADVLAEAPENAPVIVGQDDGIFSEGTDLDHITLESVLTEATSSVAQGNLRNGYMDWCVNDEVNVPCASPVLLDLNGDASQMVWEPERWPDL